MIVNSFSKNCESLIVLASRLINIVVNDQCEREQVQELMQFQKDSCLHFSAVFQSHEITPINIKCFLLTIIMKILKIIQIRL